MGHVTIRAVIDSPGRSIALTAHHISGATGANLAGSHRFTLASATPRTRSCSEDTFIKLK
ncbi:hypothetical protein GCM10027200_35000 [Lentzea nigeriaca]